MDTLSAKSCFNFDEQLPDAAEYIYKITDDYAFFKALGGVTSVEHARLLITNNQRFKKKLWRTLFEQGVFKCEKRESWIDNSTKDAACTTDSNSTHTLPGIKASKYTHVDVSQGKDVVSCVCSETDSPLTKVRTGIADMSPKRKKLKKGLVEGSNKSDSKDQVIQPELVQRKPLFDAIADMSSTENMKVGNKSSSGEKNEKVVNKSGSPNNNMKVVNKSDGIPRNRLFKTKPTTKVWGIGHHRHWKPCDDAKCPLRRKTLCAVKPKHLQKCKSPRVQLVKNRRLTEQPKLTEIDAEEIVARFKEHTKCLSSPQTNGEEAELAMQNNSTLTTYADSSRTENKSSDSDDGSSGTDRSGKSNKMVGSRQKSTGKVCDEKCIPTNLSHLDGVVDASTSLLTRAKSMKRSRKGKNHDTGAFTNSKETLSPKDDEPIPAVEFANSSYSDDVSTNIISARASTGRNHTSPPKKEKIAYHSTALKSRKALLSDDDDEPNPSIESDNSDGGGILPNPIVSGRGCSGLSRTSTWQKVKKAKLSTARKSRKVISSDEEPTDELADSSDSDVASPSPTVSARANSNLSHASTKVSGKKAYHTIALNSRKALLSDDNDSSTSSSTSDSEGTLPKPVVSALVNSGFARSLSILSIPSSNRSSPNESGKKQNPITVTKSGAVLSPGDDELNTTIELTSSSDSDDTLPLSVAVLPNSSCASTKEENNKAVFSAVPKAKKALVPTDDEPSAAFKLGNFVLRDTKELKSRNSKVDSEKRQKVTKKLKNGDSVTSKVVDESSKSVPSLPVTSNRSAKTDKKCRPHKSTSKSKRLLSTTESDSTEELSESRFVEQSKAVEVDSLLKDNINSVSLHPTTTSGSDDGDKNEERKNGPGTSSSSSGNIGPAKISRGCQVIAKRRNRRPSRLTSRCLYLRVEEPVFVPSDEVDRPAQLSERDDLLADDVVSGVRGAKLSNASQDKNGTEATSKFNLNVCRKSSEKDDGIVSEKEYNVSPDIVSGLISDAVSPTSEFISQEINKSNTQMLTYEDFVKGCDVRTEGSSLVEMKSVSVSLTRLNIPTTPGVSEKVKQTQNPNTNWEGEIKEIPNSGKAENRFSPVSSQETNVKRKAGKDLVTEPEDKPVENVGRRETEAKEIVNSGNMNIGLSATSLHKQKKKHKMMDTLVKEKEDKPVLNMERLEAEAQVVVSSENEDVGFTVRSSQKTKKKRKTMDTLVMKKEDTLFESITKREAKTKESVNSGNADIEFPPRHSRKTKVKEKEDKAIQNIEKCEVKEIVNSESTDNQFPATSSHKTEKKRKMTDTLIKEKECTRVENITKHEVKTKGFLNSENVDVEFHPGCLQKTKVQGKPMDDFVKENKEKEKCEAKVKKMVNSERMDIGFPVTNLHKTNKKHKMTDILLKEKDEKPVTSADKCETKVKEIVNAGKVDVRFPPTTSEKTKVKHKPTDNLVKGKKAKPATNIKKYEAVMEKIFNSGNEATIPTSSQKTKVKHKTVDNLGEEKGYKPIVDVETKLKQVVNSGSPEVRFPSTISQKAKVKHKSTDSFTDGNEEKHVTQKHDPRVEKIANYGNAAASSSQKAEVIHKTMDASVKGKEDKSVTNIIKGSKAYTRSILDLGVSGAENTVQSDKPCRKVDPPQKKHSEQIKDGATHAHNKRFKQGTGSKVDATKLKKIDPKVDKYKNNSPSSSKSFENTKCESPVVKKREIIAKQAEKAAAILPTDNARSFQNRIFELLDEFDNESEVCLYPPCDEIPNEELEALDKVLTMLDWSGEHPSAELERIIAERPELREEVLLSAMEKLRSMLQEVGLKLEDIPKYIDVEEAFKTACEYPNSTLEVTVTKCGVSFKQLRE